MSLFNELKTLVEKYADAPSGRPAEWTDYPETEQEGRKQALDILVNRKPVPGWLDARDYHVWFKAGPFIRMKFNPNGWAYTTYSINGRVVMEATIEARIKEALNNQ